MPLAFAFDFSNTPRGLRNDLFYPLLLCYLIEQVVLEFETLEPEDLSQMKIDVDPSVNETIEKMDVSEKFEKMEDVEPSVKETELKVVESTDDPATCNKNKKKKKKKKKHPWAE